MGFGPSCESRSVGFLPKERVLKGVFTILALSYMWDSGLKLEVLPRNWLWREGSLMIWPLWKCPALVSSRVCGEVQGLKSWLDHSGYLESNSWQLRWRRNPSPGKEQKDSIGSDAEVKSGNKWDYNWQGSYKFRTQKHEEQNRKLKESWVSIRTQGGARNKGSQWPLFIRCWHEG